MPAAGEQAAGTFPPQETRVNTVEAHNRSDEGTAPDGAVMWYVSCA